MSAESLACRLYWTRSKCLKQVIGKKSALGDKAAVRKSDAILDLSRMPCVRGITTVEEYKSQSATVSELVQSPPNKLTTNRF